MAVHSYRPTVTIGELPLAPALEGWWTLPDFPERVTVDRRSFQRAVWRQPYEGVVEQYREEVPRNSMHLKVYSDGRWVVDHIDEANPDLGRPVEHFFSDHPLGKFVKSAAPVCAVGIGMLILAKAISRA